MRGSCMIALPPRFAERSFLRRFREHPAQLELKRHWIPDIASRFLDDEQISASSG